MFVVTLFPSFFITLKQLVMYDSVLKGVWGNQSMISEDDFALIFLILEATFTKIPKNIWLTEIGTLTLWNGGFRYSVGLGKERPHSVNFFEEPLH